MPVRALFAVVVVVLAPLFPASFSQSVDGSVRAALVAMLLVSAARPAIGLSVLAAAIPVSGLLTALTDGADTLGLALLAGATTGAALHGLFRFPAKAAAPGLIAAATIFVAVVLGSAAVHLAVAAHLMDAGASIAQLAWRDVPLDYLTGRGVFREIHAALLLVQCGALVPLAAGASSDSRARTWLHAGLVAGTALLAAHGVQRALEIAHRSDAGFWSGLLEVVRDVRVSPDIADLNAAGSVLALGLLLSLGLRGMPRLRAAWLAPLLAIGTWLTGSRTAIAALLVVFAVRWTSRGHWLRSALALTAALAVVTALHLLRPSANPASAMTIRIELAKAALRITGTAPIFGVGVGEFYGLSERFASPALKRFYVRQNAHNNFLQILAETGVVGLGAFLAMLGTILVPAVRRLRRTADGPLTWMTLGVVAYLLTCLAGHPLLVFPSAVPFWLALGLLAAAAPCTSDQASASRIRAPAALPIATAVAMVLVVGSVPVRARAAVDAANMEHRGIGLSRWQRDPQGIAYRTFAGHGSVFAPVSPGGVEVGLRLGGARGPSPHAEVRVSIDGVPFATVQVIRSEWRYFTFIVPPSGDTRFRRIDLDAQWASETQGGRPPVIRLTKVDER